MRRKVAQIGPATLMVSLPSKWAKEHSIRKGDEVEIELKENSLIVRTDGKEELEKVSIDISKQSERVTRWSISALHKKGYDEIEIFYSKKEQLRLVNELLKDLFMGFAIIEQSDKRIVLKSMAKDAAEEFDNALRRAYLVALSMADSCLKMIKEKKFSELSGLLSLEKTNNQLTNFCERVINKHLYRDHKKSHLLYVVAWNLEKICDDFKYICEYLSKEKKVMIGKEYILFFERSIKCFRDYYELFWKFNMDKLVEVTKNRKELLKEAGELIEKANQNESIVILNLFNMIMKCGDFSASMIALNT